MNQVIVLIFAAIFVVGVFGTEHSLKNIPVEYEHVLEKLRSSDISSGPAIPRFIEPGRYSPKPFADQPDDVKTFTIKQKLDNFDEKETRTFDWRYHLNSKYYKPGGPIIIWVGGEWPTRPEEITEGTYYADLAKYFNASLFYSEHRYYGKSHPFKDLKNENLKYLSIEQGMADLAAFIQYIKKDELSNAKVILIGGSYTGALVSWFRAEYPELTVGAWSSSGVINTKADFTEYKVGAGQDYFLAGGQKCYNAIQNVFYQLESWADQNKTDLIEEKFKTCKPFVTDNELDVQAFFNVLGWNMAEINQVIRGNDTKYICDIILDERSTPIDGVALIIHTLVGECIPGRFENIAGLLNRTELEAPASIAYRQWFYQLCTGMGLFWTTSSPYQPFGTKVPLEFWSEVCTAAYGRQFTPKMLEDEANKRLEKYGGVANPKFTNVYTSQGQLDPWMGGGVTNDVNENSPTYVIEGAGHCFDITKDHTDLAGVRESQRRVQEEMTKWLVSNAATHGPILILLIGLVGFLQKFYFM